MNGKFSGQNEPLEANSVKRQAKFQSQKQKAENKETNSGNKTKKQENKFHQQN